MSVLDHLEMHLAELTRRKLLMQSEGNLFRFWFRYLSYHRYIWVYGQEIIDLLRWRTDTENHNGN